MTGALIFLVSIFIGIIAANLFGYFKKNHSFGFIGNTLIGVFGSILLIKAIGKFGFDPLSIIENGTVNSLRFIINCVASALGGILGLLGIKLIVVKMNKMASH